LSSSLFRATGSVRVPPKFDILLIILLIATTTTTGLVWAAGGTNVTLLGLLAAPAFDGGSNDNIAPRILLSSSLLLQVSWVLLIDLVSDVAVAVVWHKRKKNCVSI